MARPLENGPGKEAAASVTIEQSKTHVHNSSANMGHPLGIQEIDVTKGMGEKRPHATAGKPFCRNCDR
jgi:hypothetical protein